MNSNILKKFLSFSLGSYVAMGIGFITTPIVTRIISPEEYGIFSIYNLIVNIILLLSLVGLDQGFIRYFYEVENRKVLLKKCILISLINYFIIIFLILLFRERISIYIFQKSNLKYTILLIFHVFIMIFNTFIIRLIRMEQKGFLFSILQILTPLLNFLFIILFYRQKEYIEFILISGVVFSNTLVTIFSLYLSRKSWSFFSKNSCTDKKIENKELIKYSYPIFLSVILSWGFQSVDKILLKQLSNMYEVGIYAASFKVVSIFNIITSGFNLFWTPLAFERYKKNSEDKVFFEKVFENMSFIMILLVFILMLSKNIFIFILGERYREATNVMGFLLFIPFMETLSNITAMGIYLKKQSKYHIFVSLIITVFSVTMNILLIPKLGGIGAGIVVSISYILYFILRTEISKKLINFKFKLFRFYIILIFILFYNFVSIFYINEHLIKSLILMIFILIILLYKDTIANLRKEVLKYKNF